MQNNSNKPNPVYIVTGATDPVGSVVTRLLVEEGKAVVMACYNVERAHEMAQELNNEHPGADITCMELDLNSFAQVADFVNRLKALDRPVAALVNNASYISRRSELSPDGYQKVVQVNFLSTVLLTLLVRPLLLPDSHVTFNTTMGLHGVSLPYEFPAASNFLPIAAYAQSKLAMGLFSIYLSTRLRTSRILVNNVDPGIFSLSMARVNRWFDRFDLSLSRGGDINGGARTMMRALQSNDTGFIFKGADKQIKASTLLKNRDVFIKLCNDTMRLMNKLTPRDENA